MHTPRLRAAEPRDAAAIVGLITELAEFEHLTHLLQVTPESLATHLFGPRPAAECVVAEGAQGTLVAFALFFTNFSTFLGKPGLYTDWFSHRPVELGASGSLEIPAHGYRVLIQWPEHQMGG